MAGLDTARSRGGALMASVAELEARLETLKAARASGVRKVEYDGNSVEYRSDAELRRAIQDLTEELRTAQGGQSRKSLTVRMKKGW
ncbi:hypothetical protein [Hyphomonas sp.]|uniref:phage head-tail joining protein n=1 Tax=Hyphomonas sp. TaxID=87 RepID=UPI0025B8A395|nr:hypothetical protein [Hyphomonas sp.]